MDTPLNSVVVSRKRRLDALNAVLDANANANKKTIKDTTYSYVAWPQVSGIFNSIDGNLEEVIELSEFLPDASLGRLMCTLSDYTEAFGRAQCGNEAKRQHFIIPILVAVVRNVVGVKISVEENVNGKYLHCHGHFEFVISKGNKRICIVEAKEEQFSKGRSQAMLGVEALAETQELHEVFGIVTNYVEWVFFKSMDDKVTEYTQGIAMDHNGFPKVDSIREIASIILSILQDEA